MIVKVINKSKNPLPTYATPGSAGMDVRVDIDEPVTIKPLDKHFFPTGLYVEIPRGYEIQLRPRSGMACKYGIIPANTPSTIDSDYRGEIMICLRNLSNEEFTINPGERVCQMVLAKHEVAEWEVVDVLSDTERGEGGFGSTGVK